MITTWSELERWIRDNNLSRWIFTKSNRDKTTSQEGGTPNDKIVDSDYYGESIEDKLAITKRNLEQYGRLVYGYGWFGSKKTDGMYCEVLLSQESVAPAGVGSQPIDVAGLENRIRSQVKAELEAERYAQERKDFEKEKAEFEKDKASAIGLMVGYLKPYIPLLNQTRKIPHVAGIDAPSNVTAPRIEAKNEENIDEVESVFSDEEANKLFDLLTRFKKIEPQYMELIEAVVTMVENGDPTYTMAKGFLIK